MQRYSEQRVKSAKALFRLSVFLNDRSNFKSAAKSWRQAKNEAMHQRKQSMKFIAILLADRPRAARPTNQAARVQKACLCARWLRLLQ